jgi:hypothetical protein
MAPRNYFLRGAIIYFFLLSIRPPRLSEPRGLYLLVTAILIVPEIKQIH